VLREQITTASDGTRSVKLVDVGATVPGNAVVYTMTFVNTGGKPATNLVINNPVAKDVTYTGPAIGSADPVVSIDGGLNYGALETLTVRSAAGQARAAQKSDVTNVRWTIAGLAPGAEGQVSYRALIK
jgi:uncharacterized repeat protein (TIGR01451 family)